MRLAINIIKKIAFVLACAILAISLFSFGFFACLLPITTQALSHLTSDFEKAPYTSEQLRTLALATRDFTVDDYGRAAFGESGARQTLANHIEQAALAACESTSPVADRWTEQAKRIVEGANAEEANSEKADAEGVNSEGTNSKGANDEDENTIAASQTSLEDKIFVDLANVDTSYTLDENALLHLSDCNLLIHSVLPWLIACTIAAFLILAALHIANKRSSHCAHIASLICMIAPLTLTCALCALGIWAALDFNGFFTAFHALLFSQGNWTFGDTSLLICMYPTRFWMGMGAIWASVSLACCAASFALSRKLRKL